MNHYQMETFCDETFRLEMHYHHLHSDFKPQRSKLRSTCSTSKTSCPKCARYFDFIHLTISRGVPDQSPLSCLFEVVHITRPLLTGFTFLSDRRQRPKTTVVSCGPREDHGSKDISRYTVVDMVIVHIMFHIEHTMSQMHISLLHIENIMSQMHISLLPRVDI